MMKIIGVIPARYESSRLPGKIIADIGGKPMVQHVWENASRSQLIQELYIAVDDKRVQEAVEKFGGKSIMTAPELPSGTDRVAEVAKLVPDAEIICNIQGDEPFSNPAIIDEAIQPLIDNSTIGFSTVMHSVDEEEGFEDPGVVKCVRDKDGFGLYFSRSRIPYPRYGNAEMNQPYEHLGIYAYRRDALLRFVTWPPSPLELMESLEMLRILDNDEKIYVAKSQQPFYALSVDTQEDLERAREFYEKVIIPQQEGGNK